MSQLAGGFDVDTQEAHVALSAQACSCVQQLASEQSPHVALLSSNPHCGFAHMGSLAHSVLHASHMQSVMAKYKSAPAALF